MKRVIAALGLTIASTSFGAAADLSDRFYTKAAAAPVYNWAGFYIGGQLGGLWSTTGLSRVGPDPGGAINYSVNNASVAAGGFAGVQGQFGQFVLGLEGGYATGFSGTTFATPSTNIFDPGGTGTATVKGGRDVRTIGARAGYAINNWLPYLSGGYASGRFGFDAISTGGVGPESASARLDGYYVGVGLDYAIVPNWIVGGEYRHYEFESKTVTASPSPFLFDPETVNIGGRGDTFMGRLSYKFNSVSPAVAK